MKRKMTTLIALALTCLLVFYAPKLLLQAAPGQRSLKITRIWMDGIDPAAAKWLRQQSAAYEKKTGTRIYLRNASREETEDAFSNQAHAILPDLIITCREGEPLAYLGYALIVRDDRAKVTTPAPTAALFHRPTSAPDPAATAAPTPDMTALGAILSPDSLSVSLPGFIPSAQARDDFIAGKAPAALLTAGQAHALPFGYQAFPLPGKEGAEIISGRSFSKAGQDFSLFLMESSSQLKLKDHGLYSVLPQLRLYDENDPLRMLIEESLK